MKLMGVKTSGRRAALRGGWWPGTLEATTTASNQKTPTAIRRILMSFLQSLTGSECVR
jgi:hypothetical protein